MQSGSFRQVVREELILWMDKNRGRFDILMSRVLEQIAPVVAEQLERGILVRVGHLDTDEREMMGSVIEQARDFISTYGLAKPNAVDRADIILKELDHAILTMQAPPRSKGS